MSTLNTVDNTARLLSHIYFFPAFAKLNLIHYQNLTWIWWTDDSSWSSQPN